MGGREGTRWDYNFKNMLDMKVYENKLITFFNTSNKYSQVVWNGRERESKMRLEFKKYARYSFIKLLKK